MKNGSTSMGDTFGSLNVWVHSNSKDPSIFDVREYVFDPKSCLLMLFDARDHRGSILNDFRNFHFFLSFGHIFGHVVTRDFAIFHHLSIGIGWKLS